MQDRYSGWKGEEGRNNNKQILYTEWSPPWHFKAYILTYILAFYLTFYGIYSDISFDILSSSLSGIYSGICSDILSGILSDIHFYSLCILCSKSFCGRCPAENTLIPCLLFASGGDHFDPGLAVRVRRGPLRSSACSWGRAGTTLILNLPTLTWQVGKTCCAHILAHTTTLDPIRNNMMVWKHPV